jgi:hypothetical protein
MQGWHSVDWRAVAFATCALLLVLCKKSDLRGCDAQLQHPVVDGFGTLKRAYALLEIRVQRPKLQRAVHLGLSRTKKEARPGYENSQSCIPFR